MSKKGSARALIMENEELFHITFEQAPVGIAHVKPNGKFVRVNQRFCEIVKYSREEMLSMTFQDITHADDINKDLTSLRKMLKGELKTYSREKQYLCKDKSTVWVNLTISLTRNQSNEPNYFISVLEDITNRKAMENALKESEEKFRLLFEAIADPIHVIDADLKIIYMNPAFEKWLKSYNLYFDAIGKNPVEAWPHIGEEVNDEYKKVFETKKIHIKEDWTHINDIDIFTEARKIPIIKSGKVIQIITIVRDFSDRKKAEQKLNESEEKFRVLFENSTSGIAYHEIVYDSIGNPIDYVITDVNPFYEKILSFKKKNVINKMATEIYQVESAPYLNIFSRVTETQESYSFEALFPPMNKHFKISVISPKKGEFITVFDDITREKDTERKIKYQAELVENVSDAIISTDTDFNIKSWNRAAEKIYGWEPDEIIGKNIRDTITVEYPNHELDTVIKQLFEEGTWQGEVIQPHKNGTPINIYSSVSLIKDETGNSIGIVAINRDISKQKKAEHKLKESEKKYRHLFESSPYFIGLIDENGILVDCNSSISKFLSMRTKEDVIGKKIVDILSIVEENKEIIPLLKDLFQEAHSDEQGKSHEIKLHRSTGGFLWLNIEGSTVEINNRTLFQFIVQDITNRKIIEEELKESEIKFRTITEQFLMGIGILQDEELKYANLKFANMFGYTVEEFTDMTYSEFLTYIHPEDRAKLLRQVEKRKDRTRDTGVTYQFRAFKKTGELFWVNIYSRIINYQGKRAGLLAILDTTEIKMGELKLKESEEKFRTITEDSHLAITILQDDLVVYTNQQMADMLGYDRKEILTWTPKDFAKIMTEDDLEFAVEQARKKKVGDPNEKLQYQLHCVKSSGEKFWVDRISTTIMYKGRPADLITIIDITEMKTAELKLRESEEKYRVLFENSTSSIAYHRIVYDSIGNPVEYIITDVNPQFETIVSLKKKNVINRRSTEFYQVDSAPYLDIFSHTAEIGESTSFETYFSPLDKCFNVSVISPTRGEFITVFDDISERKKSEHKLKESEENFRTITEDSHLAITILQDDLVVYTNQQMADMFGYDREEMLAWTPKEFAKTVAEDSLEFVLEQARKKQIGDPNVKNQYQIHCVKSSGEKFWVDNISTTIMYKGRPADLVTIIDITEKRRAEEKLKESEKKYRHLFESSPFFIGLIDENGTLVDSNSSINNFLSMRTKEDVIGKNILNILSIVEENKEIIPLLKNIFQEVHSNEPGKSHEFKLHRSTGGFLWLKVKGSTVEINNQKLLQFIVEDVTNRKVIEEGLKESEIKFRTITEQSFMGIIIIQDGIFKYFNQQAIDINGYSREEIQNWEPYEFLKLIHSDDRQVASEQVRKKESGDKDVVENNLYRIIQKSGEIIWIESYSKTIFFEGKTADLVMSVDITEKILAEQKLKESEEKFRKIFEANPSGLHLYNLTPDGDLIFKGANYAADKILKSHQSQNIGKTLEEAFPPLIETEIPTKYKLVASEGKTLNWEYFSTDQINGVYEIYAFQTAPGKMVASFLDISDRIEAEQRLKEMNRLKGELIRRASHELRTPLTSINGAVELLLTVYKKEFSEETEDFLNIIKKGGKRLENLIKDLLNVSTLQSKNLEIIKRRENIVKLIFDSIDEIKIFASEREINIIFSQEESIYIDVDKNKILQVFINLLMNALKYTPPKGEVSIKIEILTENLIDIIIKDTGIGFTEEEKKIVFKQFGKIERFGQGFHLNTEGSGLGLYISKELVELHSGKLWVESEGRSKGSSFIIRLPKL